MNAVHDPREHHCESGSPHRPSRAARTRPDCRQDREQRTAEQHDSHKAELAEHFQIERVCVDAIEALALFALPRQSVGAGARARQRMAPVSAQRGPPQR
jgi:hypothetical protein